MDTVGNQTLRFGQDAGCDLGHGQNDVDAHADPGTAGGRCRALRRAVFGVFGIVGEVVEIHGR